MRGNCLEKCVTQKKSLLNMQNLRPGKSVTMQSKILWFIFPLCYGITLKKSINCSNWQSLHMQLFSYLFTYQLFLLLSNMMLHKFNLMIFNLCQRHLKKCTICFSYILIIQYDLYLMSDRHSKSISKLPHLNWPHQEKICLC